MTERKDHPTLYGLSRVGKVKQWTVWVEKNEDDTAIIHTEAGYVDGKIVDKPKNVYKGKNIGKKNETNPYEQACNEALSKWKKKRDQNYEEVKPDPDNYIPRIMLPMLAKGMGKGKIIYPCFLQPKLNGICDLAEKQVGILHHSRGGKLFETLGHLDEWIHMINPPAPLHGEIYKHGWSLQVISSYTKDLKDDAHLIEYWLYDIAWLKVPYIKRIQWLTDACNKLPKESPLKLTPTVMVNNEDEKKKYHDQWVEMGFEGGMLKNINGLYMFEFNSNDLEKVKSFEDAEYPIVGGKEGTGGDEGCVIFRCKTKDGLEFDVRPRGTREVRKEMYDNLESYIGKPLTVRFPELYDSGIPAQPVGIAVRDYE